MNELLTFIVQYCSFLYNEYGFRFTDSLADESFGGNAFVVLESPDLRLRFVRDRAQIFLDVRSQYDRAKDDWFSFDLVRKLIQDESGYHAIMDQRNVEFLRKHMHIILDLFSRPKSNETLAKLQTLEAARAKKRLG